MIHQKRITAIIRRLRDEARDLHNVDTSGQNNGIAPRFRADVTALEWCARVLERALTVQAQTTGSYPITAVDGHTSTQTDEQTDAQTDCANIQHGLLSRAGSRAPVSASATEYAYYENDTRYGRMATDELNAAVNSIIEKVKGMKGVDTSDLTLSEPDAQGLIDSDDLKRVDPLGLDDLSEFVVEDEFGEFETMRDHLSKWLQEG